MSAQEDIYDKTPEERAAERRHRRHMPVVTRIVLWAGGIVFGLVALVVIGLSVATWWLTPERVTGIINRELSEELEADVRASNVRYTLWSTFPHLCVEVDSLSLRSRTLDSLPASLRKRLPEGADFLLSTGHVKGGVNLLRLLSHQIWLRDVSVDSLKLNLVAVTDSINNYDIVPDGKRSRMPYIHIDGMNIKGRGDIKYTSLPSGTNADMRLSVASLTPGGRGRNSDNYDLRLGGKIDVRSGELEILRDFPIAMQGDVHFRFAPFGISTDDYRVKLGNIKGKLDMDMDLGDNMKLNSLAYDLSDFDIEELKAFLPARDYPVLERLDMNLLAEASARLTTPYDFKSVYLPSLEVGFRVPDGEIGYTFSDNRRYAMRHVGVEGRFVFDGRNPSASYVEVPEIRMSGEGVSLSMSGGVTRLTTEPEIKARIHGRGNLTRLGREINYLRPYGLSGDMEIEGNVLFRVRGDRLRGTLADVTVRSDKMGMKYDGARVTVSGLEASTSESYAEALTKGAVLEDIPVNVDVKAKGLKVDDRRRGMGLRADGLTVKGKMGRHGDGKVNRRVDLNVRSEGLGLHAEGTKVDMKGVSMKLGASRLNAPVKTRPYATPSRWHDDSYSLGFAPHTPEVLQVSIPDEFKEIMSQWLTRLDLQVAEGTVDFEAYRARNSFKDLDMTASFDSLQVRNLTLNSDRTRGRVSARISNLRQFLNSPTPAPLYVGLDVAFDTLQINQLSRAYTRGNPGSAIARGDKEAMGAGPDSICFLLPRNIVADIRARAMQTRYINLHLYDLWANVRVADGRADIDTLRLSSSFGQLAMNLAYDTSDIQNMRMKTHMEIYDIDVVNFFANFPQLLAMMPAMKNLTGNLSASLDGRMRIFPNMYVNVPSVWANAWVHGRDLVLHQNQFVRKVTRMLMLPKDDDLYIKDIAVHAGVHSNLLEVFPFTFEMSKYRLVLNGLNNFNGDLYYHIGVMDWPLKLPFGVNIKGTYHEPVLRFGGKYWHDDNATKIAGGVNDINRVNVSKLFRRYGGEFVHTAAVYNKD